MPSLSLARRRATVAVACLGALSLSAVPALTASAQRPDVGSDAVASASRVDRSTALVQLSMAPLSTADDVGSKNGKVNLNSNAAKKQSQKLAAQRSAFRSWLRTHASGAKITGHHDLALNAVTVKLRGTSLATLRQAPQVTSVQYDAYYHPTADNDPDLSRIDAQQAWTAAAGGDADAGALPDGSRIKVGVIDTGIDVNHPCFDDAGFPTTAQRGDTRFTNNKVIVARVFANKAKSQGLTAEALQDHGTHVSGTVACDLNTPAEVDGVTVPYTPSGVAPAAQLGNYNVFPGGITNARTEDILNALEAAYRDGMDVVNMSLGGDANGSQDLLTHAVDNLDRAGLVSAISAGNSGPGAETVGSPGSAERALTSGASTVGHFVGAPVTVAGTTYGAASGDFATVDSDLTKPLAVVTGSVSGLSDGCSAIGTDLTGKIALVSRGGCSFSVKVRNVQSAGGAAALVANNVAGDPVAMASDGTPDQPTIPAYMVARNSGQQLKSHDGDAATIGAAKQYLRTSNDDIMAGFSSRGPTDVDFRIKPDIVAPGVNVLSSIPLSECGAGASTCWAFFQGTSMASPHSAGSAAVVMDAFISRGFDGFTAEQVRSAIVNTAEQNVLTSYTDGTTQVNAANIVGAGQVDLDSAVAAKVAMGPVSTSFGSVPSGSGQTLTGSVALSSLTETPHAVTLSVADPADGAAFSTSSTTVTVPASGVVRVPVSVTVAKGTAPGNYQAQLDLAGAGGVVEHSMLYVFVK